MHTCVSACILHVVAEHGCCICGDRLKPTQLDRILRGDHIKLCTHTHACTCTRTRMRMHTHTHAHVRARAQHTHKHTTTNTTNHHTHSNNAHTDGIVTQWYTR